MENFYEKIYDKIIINQEFHQNINKDKLNLRSELKNEQVIPIKMNQNSNLKTVDMSKLSYKCGEIGCEWCEKANIKKCIQCKTGFFLLSNKCYAMCPKEFVADIYSRTCKTFDNKGNFEIK